MKMNRRLLILPIVMLTAVIFTSAATGEKNLPAITLKDINGKEVNVADYGRSGKVTIINFWATWCGGCRRELANMSDLYGDWQKKYNLQIVAVSIDDAKNADKVKKLIEGEKWKYDVLLDANQDLKRGLNIMSVPYTLLLDQTGKIVYAHSGYIGGDEYIIEEQIQKLIKQ